MRNTIRNSLITTICAIPITFISTFASALITDGAQATLSVQNEWNGGYCADVTIENISTTNITSWRIELDLHQSQINNLWNASHNGTTVTPADFNSTINTNSSISFGFCANATGTDYLPSISEMVVTRSTTGDNDGGDDGDAPQTGCDGYATRFWDCCKPHCGWSANVPTGMSATTSCSANNQVLSNLSTPSSCNGGDAHTCYGLTPFTVSETLAYGYAATSSGDVCGRCYQLSFTGTSYNSSGDPGSAALLGKTMIVQAINIGYDVSGGQFDILVPGGGVGAFNACSAQWGVSNSELGAQYGGMLAACKQELGYNASLSSYKSCLTNRCNSVFGTRGLTELQNGCLWYAGWFEAADNPALKYKEVACPTELSAGTGMDRGFLNDISNACGN